MAKWEKDEILTTYRKIKKKYSTCYLECSLHDQSALKQLLITSNLNSIKMPLEIINVNYNRKRRTFNKEVHMDMSGQGRQCTQL